MGSGVEVRGGGTGAGSGVAVLGWAEGGDTRMGVPGWEIGCGRRAVGWGRGQGHRVGEGAGGTASDQAEQAAFGWF